MRIVLALAEVVSVLCVVHLWRRRDASLASRIVFTPLALIPIVGPLFYGGMFEAPAPRAAHAGSQPEYTPLDITAGGTGSHGD
jgi:hypothetical protein